jgi:RimJ/RimL family protein N-acetyltransferase
MRLQTERLMIRSFVESDIAAFAELVADPEVMRDVGGGETHSAEKAAEYVRRCIARDRDTGAARYAVIDRADGRFLGMCGYAPERGATDFGWRLRRDAWGRGYGTEAAVAVLEYGLTTLSLTDIFAHAFADNAASIRIIEKLGFEFVEEDHLYGRSVVRYRPSIRR